MKKMAVVLTMVLILFLVSAVCGQSTAITVIDTQTKLPIKDVQLRLDGRIVGVTDLNGKFNMVTVGVQDQDNEKTEIPRDYKIQCCGNPFDKQTMLSFIAQQDGELLVVNVNGQTLLRQPISAGHHAMGLLFNNLARGVYLIILKSGNAVQYLKVTYTGNGFNNGMFGQGVNVFAHQHTPFVSSQVTAIALHKTTTTTYELYKWGYIIGKLVWPTEKTGYLTAQPNPVPDYYTDIPPVYYHMSINKPKNFERVWIEEGFIKFVHLFNFTPIMSTENLKFKLLLGTSINNMRVVWEGDKNNQRYDKLFGHFNLYLRDIMYVLEDGQKYYCQVIAGDGQEHFSPISQFVWTSAVSANISKNIVPLYPFNNTIGYTEDKDVWIALRYVDGRLRPDVGFKTCGAISKVKGIVYFDLEKSNVDNWKSRWTVEYDNPTSVVCEDADICFWRYPEGLNSLWGLKIYWRARSYEGIEMRETYCFTLKLHPLDPYASPNNDLGWDKIKIVTNQ